jgi:hypothetical protein
LLFFLKGGIAGFEVVFFLGDFDKKGGVVGGFEAFFVGGGELSADLELSVLTGDHLVDLIDGDGWRHCVLHCM